MENTGGLCTERIYVEKFDSEYIYRGARITFVKPDGRSFSDSEMDKIFWKAFEYSNNGPKFTERDGSRMIIAMRNLEEARDFINGVALREDNINITEKVNVVSSESSSSTHRVTLSRRGTEEFTKAEINAIFQNTLNSYDSLKKFEPSSDRREVSVYFDDMDGWREFIEQFMCEDVKAKMKKMQLPKKEEKRGFFRRLFSL